MKYKKRSRINNISLVITIFCFVTVLIFANLRNNSRLINSTHIVKESIFYPKSQTENNFQQEDKFLTESEDSLSFESLEILNNKLSSLNISLGGSFKPTDSEPKYKIAVIVPYRNREKNLKIFLKNIHPFLINQRLEYSIFLIEPIESVKFNRGLLLNIGFLESIQLANDKWNCFVFHDVDLIPESEKNFYYCPPLPKHMSSAVSTFDYKLPYKGLFGGVTILTKKHMEKINGFSNMYFGWGGEDDDLRKRIISKGYKLIRNNLETGRYRMLNHEKDFPNPKRFKLLKTSAKRISTDGLNTIKYVVVSVKFEHLFTKIIVSYDESFYIKTKTNY